MPHSSSTAPSPDTLAALRDRLATAPNGVLEAVATETGVSLLAVTECLPDGLRAFAPGETAEAAMLDMAEWGTVTVLVHSADLVLECKGPLPRGQVGRGFYNLAGGSPSGGGPRDARAPPRAIPRRAPLGGAGRAPPRSSPPTGGAH
ncbi:ChuX/HutX family heme-like substrate-binding protein, partial [Azospirillum brasilense]|uniref:ChuX/HutX family heme-like substrate-binding protein n=1 Tax=Azospirillum brasilense TaxID=192 RepID=UPI00190B1003